LSRHRFLVATLAAATAMAGGVYLRLRARPPAASDDRRAPVHPPHRGDATVWATTAGMRLTSDAGAHPAMGGNPVWQPDRGIELFGLRGETIAVQVVVTAGAEPLSGVRVELEDLDGIDVERFVTLELPMRRRSAGRDPSESLGWLAGAQPPGPAPRGHLVDPLLPVALASHPQASHPEAAQQGRPWDYPMTVPRTRHRVLWLDLHLPANIEAGAQQGRVVVSAGKDELASMALNLDVGRAQLPYAAAKTMLFVEPDVITARAGADALRPTLQLLHRHHITPILNLTNAEQLDDEPMRGLLSGAMFTAEQGYRGPGEGRAVDLVVLGMYGSFDTPDLERVQAVAAITERLDAIAPRTDRFLYAVDEECDSPLGPAWRQALHASDSATARKLEVGHTCSEPPADQSVDLVMMFAPAFRPALAAAAKDKRVWIYNGVLPYTGSFLSDGWDSALIANPWIQWRHGIERWFYWESVFYDDGNRGGQGPYDPFATAETFHNSDGDHCNGDGVLLYPGAQKRPGYLNLGSATTLPSFRLKQWRRGIQDVGYLELLAERDESAARRIANDLVGDNFRDGIAAPTFPTDAAAFHRARRAMFDRLR
jgi:hypothetical protein